jgi:thioredoxin reductase
VKARTVLLATGITDAIPDLPGLSACLGESVFICPDCDGYESVNRRTAVIGAGASAARLAKALLYYTSQLLVVNHTGSTMSDEALQELRENGISVYQSEVARIEEQNGAIRSVCLRSGESIRVERAFVAFPGAQVNTQLLRRFPVRLLDNGHVLVNPRTKETSCRNIWAVGDIAAHSQMATIAMGDGSQAAVWIHKRLLEQKQKSPVHTSPR